MSSSAAGTGEHTRGLGWEVVLVLGVSLGASAVRSVVSIIEKLTRSVPLGQQTTTMNSSYAADRPWLDLTYQLTGITLELVPVALVAYLVWVRPGPGADGADPGPWRRLGCDLSQPWRDGWRGVVVAAAIGIPGLGFYLGARQLGLNTTVQPADLAEHWWTVPVYVLAAFMNGAVEEIIMLGYVFWRLRQIGWSWWSVLATSALIRGSYHLYQGFGGFAGNVIMGVLFGLLFLRWRRSAPLVVAHTLIDIAAFVGYALLADGVSWL